MKKQTQKQDKNKKKRTILLATLIPIGAAVVATAITLPLVLRKPATDDSTVVELKYNSDITGTGLDGYTPNGKSDLMSFEANTKYRFTCKITDSPQTCFFFSDSSFKTLRNIFDTETSNIKVTINSEELKPDVLGGYHVEEGGEIILLVDEEQIKVGDLIEITIKITDASAPMLPQLAD